MSEQIRDFYEFQPFTIDASKRLLLREGEPVPLKPKVFDTLLVLVENRDRVVDKEELMQLIWPDVAVEENNLTQNISAIRKSLNDRQNEHRYVLTVPGRGYRFVADVRKTSNITEVQAAPAMSRPEGSLEPQVPAPQSAPARRYWWLAGVMLAFILGVVGLFVAYPRMRNPVLNAPAAADSGTGKRITSIAVLPFKPLGAEATNEYDGPGMADALITKLSNSRQLTVRSTSVVLRYDNPNQDSLAAGRELGVDSVLEGKIQRSGNHVRVTVQLVRVSDGASLWAQTFDEDFTDIFRVQDSISEQVVKALTVELSREERNRMLKRYTESPEAYEAYLKGRYFLDKRTTDSVTKARDYFQVAINRDQNYALAYSGLADCYQRFAQFGIGRPEEVIPKATNAATTALRLDDSLAEAHATLGIINFRYLRNLAAAEAEFKRALDLDPRYALARVWYGLQLMAINRFKEADVEMQQAIELEPLSITINNALGDYYIQTRQYDRAIEQYRKTLELDPGFLTSRVGIGRAYEQKKMYREALEQFEEVKKRSNSKVLPGHAGYTYAVSGRKDESRKLLNGLLEEARQGNGNPYIVAVVYAGLGEKDQAFEWLEKAFADYSLLPGPLRFDPRLDSLRDDPRYKDLLRRSGLA
ncbi:MAG TPA: winged helix-turn-helix domain-containing protein [Pyrinomonadaceae bacterium]|nr:winged helix-turn-helix domain-containing protein [Pyrinomonadaceae bacterium]